MFTDLARTPRTLPAQPSEDIALRQETRRILGRRDVRSAVRYVREDDRRTLEEQLRLASTPAPPFLEAERGRLFTRLLEESGAPRCRVDDVGNVLTWIGAEGPAPLVVAAHLDTVFPTSQEIRLRQEGDRWVGPGICDDARGLAVVLALVRALHRLEAGPDFPVLVVGTVGEEGVGNLRGVRHLFGPEGAGRGARGFISVDGAGVRRVIASGVGSRRFRATLSGPGGHSWVDRDRVNPVRVLARAITSMDELPLPDGATLNVGRVQGGTSVNAIPAEVWVECETRSEREQELEQLEAGMKRSIEAAMSDANSGLQPELRASLSIESLGCRPAGATPPDAPLVRAAVAATREVAHQAELAASSTDANLPMSLGIPAITLGGGGEAGEAHTSREWYRNEQGPEGVLRALLTVLTLESASGREK